MRQVEGRKETSRKQGDEGDKRQTKTGQVRDRRETEKRQLGDKCGTSRRHGRNKETRR